MFKKMILFFLCILGSFSLSYGKNIVVGSHGGAKAYLNPYLGEVYEFFSFHGGKDKFGKDKDSDWLSNISHADEGAHGVDAAIMYLKEKTNGTIYAMMSEDAANPSVAAWFIKGNYEKGDRVFLLGYSAGGKFVVNLSELLNLVDIPVHILGLIDPVIGTNITIPSNVKKVALYYQESDAMDFQGFSWFSMDDYTKTSYFSGHPKLIDGVKHDSIIWSQDVWKDFGQKMVSDADNDSSSYEVCSGFDNSFINGQVKDELVDSHWDSICRGWHPLVERFRDKETCKLVPNYTPADGKLYLYGNYCEPVEYDLMDSLDFPNGIPTIIEDSENPGTDHSGTNDMKVSIVKVAKSANGERLHEYQAKPGEEVYSFARIVNDGIGTAKSGKVKFYIDAGKKNFNREDKDYIDSVRFSDFKSGSIIWYGLNFDAPKEEGEYYLYAVITNVDNDIDEGNNISSESDKDEYAKLIVVDPNISHFNIQTTALRLTYNRTQISVGDRYGLEVALVNTGDRTPTKGIRTSYEINGPQTNHQWVYLTDDGTDAGELSPGKIVWENVTDGFGATLNVAGTYYARACGDYQNSLFETNEKDNCITTSFLVKNLPPKVTITEPYSGVRWKSDSNHDIRWNSTNLPWGEPIIVQYRCLGNWYTIHDGYTTNDGKKRWYIDKNRTKDDRDGRIRIIQQSTGVVLGESQGFFIDRKKGTPEL